MRIMRATLPPEVTTAGPDIRAYMRPIRVGRATHGSREPDLRGWRRHPAGGGPIDGNIADCRISWAPLRGILAMPDGGSRSTLQALERTRCVNGHRFSPYRDFPASLRKRAVSLVRECAGAWRDCRRQISRSLQLGNLFAGRGLNAPRERRSLRRGLMADSPNIG